MFIIIMSTQDGPFAHGAQVPPLSGLRLFEAAARCGSFKQAAHELNLTPGAFSHGMGSLENYLDVELFERKAHGIILTAADGDTASAQPPL